MKATRIRQGEYEYKGYSIEQILTYDDKPSHWNIYEKGELCALDSCDTLRECKEMIDRW